jgi:Lysyl oxidase
MAHIRWLSPLVAALVVANAAPADAQALPDIEPSPPFDVQLVQRDGQWYLGFSMEARNVGAGTLRLRGHGDGSGVMAAEQLGEDGSQVLNPAVGTFRYVSTPTHQHWHYMDFMRYELRGIDHPGVLRDQKQGFCLAGAPFVVDWCSSGQPTLTTTELGIEPGSVEVYSANVHGQEIAVDPVSAPAGRYVIAARIGPTGVLKETRTDNNVSSTVIELEWPGAAPQAAPLPIARTDSCVGKGCTKTLPARSAAAARAHARAALRRTFGRAAVRGGRVRCRVWRDRAHACRVRLRGGSLIFRGSVRIWYVVRPSGTRWYYTIKGVRRIRGCGGGSGCTRRIRRIERVGGTVAAVQGRASLVCRLTP